MKICFISHPDVTHTRRWVDWFARRDHQVCVIADFPHQEPWPGRKVFDLSMHFNRSAFRYLPWALWTRQIVRAWQPDILHAHRVNSAGWLGAAAGFHPFVVTPWGSDLYLQPQRSVLAHRLARFVLSRSDLVTVDSHDLGQAAAQYGAQLDQIHTVQWGVDVDLFQPDIDCSQLRDKLQIEPAAQVVLSARAMSNVYQIHIIVESIPAVLQAAPLTIFLIRDYNTNQSYKRQIVQQIEKLGVGPAVRWLGVLPRWEDNIQVYNLADVVLSVPLSDGTPVSVLEAMACGTPVIASNLPSLREWINDGENGRLVPVGDSLALSHALIELLRDSSLRQRFSTRNVELIRIKANHHLEMEKMENLYASLIPGRRQA
jgi:glycosyltransferase involved in cell wall biosynthesis